MYKINDGGDDDFTGIVLSFPARHTGWYIIIYKINDGGDDELSVCLQKDTNCNNSKTNTCEPVQMTVLITYALL